MSEVPVLPILRKARVQGAFNALRQGKSDEWVNRTVKDLALALKIPVESARRLVHGKSAPGSMERLEACERWLEERECP